MNSKKLCCICVLFSLLAGCASESSIDEKKKKAQVTQSNINKNTPQQLTDKDLFGNETTLAVSEEDIQAALDGDEFRVPLNSPVILVQSGNRAPETIMQEEMRKYYTVSTFSGIPDRQKPLTCNKNKDKNENEDVARRLQAAMELARRAAGYRREPRADRAGPVSLRPGSDEPLLREHDSARTVDRIFRRDARRYDGGFALF